MSQKIFIFCGEPSGDLHGEALVQNLQKLRPNVELFGVGGPKMRVLGFQSILDMEQFQVMGFIDVFLALPRLFRHFYFLANILLKERPEVAVFIDYPGFNLRLERHLRKKGFSGKIIHYICPSVWAHGKQRIALLEKTVDQLLCIFPFEPALFSSAHFVGHPLPSRIQKEPSFTLPWSKEKQVISLFPGSRKKEILLNLPLQLKALKKAQEKGSFIGAISLSQKKFLPLILQCIEKEGLLLGSSLHLVDLDQTYALMRSTTLAIAKSGTVTLELALHQIPTVVVYGIAPLDYFIAKHLLRISLPFYCIVNIVAQKEVFKELIGPNLSEKTLTLELEKLLLPSYQIEKKNLCLEVIKLLGSHDASHEAARIILESLDNKI